jgi:hypothetical protein
MTKHAIVAVVLLALAAPASAVRVPGEQSNAFTGPSRGGLSADDSTRRCPSCADGSAAGTVAAARRGAGSSSRRALRRTTSVAGTITYPRGVVCTVDGYYEPFAYEAVYECPDGKVGAPDFVGRSGGSCPSVGGLTP